MDDDSSMHPKYFEVSWIGSRVVSLASAPCDRSLVWWDVFLTYHLSAVYQFLANLGKIMQKMRPWRLKMEMCRMIFLFFPFHLRVIFSLHPWTFRTWQKTPSICYCWRTEFVCVLTAWDDSHTWTTGRTNHETMNWLTVSTNSSIYGFVLARIFLPKTSRLWHITSLLQARIAGAPEKCGQSSRGGATCPIDIHKFHPQVWKILPKLTGPGQGDSFPGVQFVEIGKTHLVDTLLREWVVAPFPPNLEDLKYLNILNLCKHAITENLQLFGMNPPSSCNKRFSINHLSDVLPFKVPSWLVANRADLYGWVISVFGETWEVAPKAAAKVFADLASANLSF